MWCDVTDDVSQLWKIIVSALTWFGFCFVWNLLFLFEVRVRRYSFCLRLSCAIMAYVTTHEDVVNEKCGRVDGRKSWRMLVTHDSRKEKPYRLNRCALRMHSKKLAMKIWSHIKISTWQRALIIDLDEKSEVFIDRSINILPVLPWVICY